MEALIRVEDLSGLLYLVLCISNCKSIFDYNSAGDWLRILCTFSFEMPMVRCYMAKLLNDVLLG